jgi:hypothetical protein
MISKPSVILTLTAFVVGLSTVIVGSLAIVGSSLLGFAALQQLVRVIVIESPKGSVTPALSIISTEPHPQPPKGETGVKQATDSEGSPSQ